MEMYMIPTILIGTMWGAIGVVLKAFEMIIDRRDKIFELMIKAKESDGKNTSNEILTIEQQYSHTLFPISFGISLFLAIVAVMLLLLPVFLYFKFNVVSEIKVVNGSKTFWMWMLVCCSCCFAAFLPFFACIGFVRGAILDYTKIILRK